MTQEKDIQTSETLIGVAINFKNDNKVYAERLVAFFQEQPDSVHEWKAKKNQTFNDGTQFYFTNRVFKREDETQGIVYETITHKGKFSFGGYGEVHKGQRSITIHNNSLGITKTGKNGLRRAIKIQHHTKELNPLSNLKNEYEHTRLCEHIGIEKPTIVNDCATPDSYTSFTVMNLLPGKDLYDVINEDHYKKRPLSIQERIDLTYALLLALKTQITNNKLIHRDIKPENIRVDFGPPLTVKIFDLGSSMLAGKPDGEFRGTPEYTSREVVFELMNIGYKADVFSMGCTIAVLWGVKLKKPLWWTNIGKHVPSSDEPDLLEGLFTGITGLETDVKSGIQNILRGMIAEVKDRLSVEEIIDQFTGTLGRFTSIQPPQSQQGPEEKQESQAHLPIQTPPTHKDSKNLEAPSVTSETSIVQVSTLSVGAQPSTSDQYTASQLQSTTAQQPSASMTLHCLSNLLNLLTHRYTKGILLALFIVGLAATGLGIVLELTAAVIAVTATITAVSGVGAAIGFFVSPEVRTEVENSPFHAQKPYYF